MALEGESQCETLERDEVEWPKIGRKQLKASRCHTLSLAVKIYEGGLNKRPKNNKFHTQDVAKLLFPAFGE